MECYENAALSNRKKRFNPNLVPYDWRRVNAAWVRVAVVIVEGQMTSNRPSVAQHTIV